MFGHTSKATLSYRVFYGEAFGALYKLSKSLFGQTVWCSECLTIHSTLETHTRSIQREPLLLNIGDHVQCVLTFISWLSRRITHALIEVELSYKHSSPTINTLVGVVYTVHKIYTNVLVLL